ncbi:hypothetical protein N7468_007439 [Penicillium chermesinum]|uniref:Uncharacterized protein n=1 Tax=Penicillium chermesinum TaxID=63820 RepID=A0A9W9NU83_9EURO|nr:uncharacterized protein N7468_007439 [Penicillium chermesinum]KAJ5226214.1 hypothetical protein N7468_007439 [Penicillium chermesinum]
MASMDNPDSLTELSTLVERTLRDTGRFFRKSGSVASKTQAQRSVPGYYESFQQSLDNLSEQIFIAKAYLEKEYDTIKARESTPRAQDVAMVEVGQQEKAESPSAEPTKTEAEHVSVKIEAKPDGAPAPADAPGPQPKEDVAVKAEQKPETTDHPDQALTDGNDGLNFDSVLNEAGGSNSFSISLDFGDDDMGNQAFLSGSGLGNSAPSGLDQAASSQPAENNSSAPVPAGGDAFDMELQRSDGDGNGFPDQNMDDLMGPGESNFDDLFLETDNLGGEDSGNANQMEGDSLMNLDELNDDWFR